MSLWRETRGRAALLAGTALLLTGICTAPARAGAEVTGTAPAVEPGGVSAAAPAEEKPVLGLKDAWGVEVVAVRMSAAGRMVDFRYRVEDPVKSAPLFVRKTRPELLDQASGKRLQVARFAKVGPLRSSDTPEAGRTYFIMFGNPGLVKAGSRVTVAIGEFRAENLIVE